MDTFQIELTKTVDQSQKRSSTIRKRAYENDDVSTTNVPQGQNGASAKTSPERIYTGASAADLEGPVDAFEDLEADAVSQFRAQFLEYKLHNEQRLAALEQKVKRLKTSKDSLAMQRYFVPPGREGPGDKAGVAELKEDVVWTQKRFKEVLYQFTDGEGIIAKILKKVGMPLKGNLPERKLIEGSVPYAKKTQ